MKITYFNACERPEMEVERVFEKEVPEVLDMIRALADQVIEQYGNVQISFTVSLGEGTKLSKCVAWMEVKK